LKTADTLADNSSKFYPPPGFHFRVIFGSDSRDSIDTRFQSVSGLSMEFETETRKEGGELRYEHVLPVRARYSPLILKRGLVVNNSALLKSWCVNAFNNFIIEPKDLTVHLLNGDHDPIMSWRIVHAWPKKWSLSELHAEQNTLAIETFELQYHYFTIQS
jgi:phage tail-like protein